MADKRIVFTGGGSGGHVYPLLAVAQACERAARGTAHTWRFYYFGPNDRYRDLLAKADLEMRSIASSKLRRYASGIVANILDIPKFGIGILQALWHMFWVMPDAVFSKGGPGAVPVVFAAWFFKIPVMIHESDAAPGVANLISARFARRVALSFAPAAKYFDPAKVIVTGQPLRTELNRLEDPGAKEKLGFKADAPLVFIVGGSQGSTRMNEFVIVNLIEILKIGQVLHQTGPENFTETQRLTRTELVQTPLKAELQSRYLPVAFVDHMETALAAADIVVSRASSSIFEIAAYGKPSILVPLKESANDHQRANAYEYAKTGAAVVIEEQNLLPAIFLHQLKEILEKSDVREKMSAAAKTFYAPGAADAIAKEILALSA